MDISQIITAVSSVGFPIIVAWYLLTKTIPALKDSIDSNTKTMTAVNNTLAKICEHLNITQ